MDLGTEKCAFVMLSQAYYAQIIPGIISASLIRKDTKGQRGKFK